MARRWFLRGYPRVALSNQLHHHLYQVGKAVVAARVEQQATKYVVAYTHSSHHADGLFTCENLAQRRAALHMELLNHLDLLEIEKFQRRRVGVLQDAAGGESAAKRRQGEGIDGE